VILQQLFENKGEFRSRASEEAMMDKSTLMDFKQRTVPDWEMLDHRILTAKYFAKNHRHAVEFVDFINRVSEYIDHFAEVTQDVAEVTVKTTTSDTNSLTILDFALAKAIDDYAKQNNIEQERIQGNFEAAGVGIVTKQNATSDVPVGGEYQNVKKLFPKQRKKKTENFADGKKKNKDREIGIHRSSEDFAVIDLSKSADGTFWLNGVDNTDWDTTVTTGQGVDMAFEISSKARLASYDDIDKYGTGELENMGYDGVRMIDGDNVSYQIWNTDILKRTKLGENFADGKKKGKSRPGRAKRAGVDCSKSVSTLRKQAKNSSGEEQKMAHWCANMKSGRKK